MKISEAIEALKAIMNDEGDVELTLFGPSGAQGATFRVVNLRRPAGRERNLYYWNSWDLAESRGRRVAAVGGGGALDPDPRAPPSPEERR